MSRTWALLQPVDAPDANNPAETVMARWRIVQTPWWGVLLHRLDKPDSRSTLHDHPWPFLSLILRGGYTEEFGRKARFSYRPTSPHEGRVKERVQRTWRAGSLHRMRSRDPHTIVSLLRSPTWTLVLTGRRAPEPSWGYWDENGWTAWNKHPHAQEFAAAQAARQKLTEPTKRSPRRLPNRAARWRRGAR